MDLNDKIKNLLYDSIKNQDWQYAKFITTISNSGSSQPMILLFDENGNSQRFRANELIDINNLAKTNFFSYKDDIEKRFNKVEFEIYQDNTYKANFYWDDAEVKKQKSQWAFVLPQWVNDRLISLLFSAGYGEIDSWQKGVFTFQIKDKQLSFEGIIFNKEESTKVHVSLPDYLIEGILEHYEITNEGLLADEWSKWNTIIIRSPHNSLDLNKDVEYSLEN